MVRLKWPKMRSPASGMLAMVRRSAEGVRRSLGLFKASPSASEHPHSSGAAWHQHATALCIGTRFVFWGTKN